MMKSKGPRTEPWGTPHKQEQEEERHLSHLTQKDRRSAKGSRRAKSSMGHFEHAVRIDITSINVSCFFTIIKTVSISCN